MMKQRSTLQNVMPALLNIGLALVCVLIWTSRAHAAQVVTLKNDAVIDGSYIRVGDIFEGSGSYASHPLAPAPGPGEETILGPNDLERIVKAFDFQWTPIAGKHTITLSSNSMLISSPQIKKALEQSELASKVGQEFMITFDAGMEEMVVPKNIVPSIGVEDVQYDPVSERFSAIIFAPAAGQRLVSQPVSGEAARLVNLPLLGERLRSGEIISKYDLVYVQKKAKDIRNNVVTDPERIIGMTPRRSLLAMEPITESDLTFPKLVERNEHVTITLRNGPLSLTAKGRSLDDGAKGDIVNVMNIQSKRVIEAIVTGDGQVMVENFHRHDIMAMNQ